MIQNFIDHHDLVLILLEKYTKDYFGSQTLVLNDTRGVILPEVLPYIPFVGGYEQRVLSLLHDTHTVLSSPYDPKIIEYFQSLDLCHELDIEVVENIPSLTLTQIILQSEEMLEKLRHKNLKYLVPFCVTEDTETLAGKLGLSLFIDHQLFKNANNKAFLKDFLQTHHLPTLEGVITQDAKIIESYYQKEAKHLFKDPLGVSGYGFWSNKEHTLDEILTKSAGIDIIIEPFIIKESSPSVQFFIPTNGENPIIFGITEQILENETIYLGNFSPSRYHGTSIERELLRQSQKIITWLQEIKYVGFGGIDFMVSEDKKVYATEVNARLTGASFPTIVTAKLTGSLYHSRKYLTREDEPAILEDFLEDCIKTPEQHGIFPLCIGPLALHGKAQLLHL